MSNAELADRLESLAAAWGPRPAGKATILEAAAALRAYVQELGEPFPRFSPYYAEQVYQALLGKERAFTTRENVAAVLNAQDRLRAPRSSISNCSSTKE